jgi:cell fate regulator YaaT (PSP1 superfamily)
MEIIGIRYRNTDKIYSFSPKGMKFKKGDYVIVRSRQGKQLAKVILANYYLPQSELKKRVTPILAKATSKDLAYAKQLHQEEIRLFKKAKEIVRKHGLLMKLVSANYLFDKSKLTITFTAEKRVDFRRLVRDLVGSFKVKVELRQIGVRDEAKILGGIAGCGREFCCSTFLGNFMSVSIKMAKEQSLSLNPLRISGLCDRLLCCLKYEDKFYKEARRRLPNRGVHVKTPLGEGIVQAVNYINEVLRIKVIDRETFVDYKFEEIQVLDKKNEYTR